MFAQDSKSLSSIMDGN